MQPRTYGIAGFPSLLTLLFIALKLTHHIDWSWLWILSPFWIPIALAAFLSISIFFMAFTNACWDVRHEKTLRRNDVR